MKSECRCVSIAQHRHSPCIMHATTLTAIDSVRYKAIDTVHSHTSHNVFSTSNINSTHLTPVLASVPQGGFGKHIITGT